MSTALLLLLMWGQAPPAIREASPPAAAQLANDDYVVGPQDVLNLTVFNDDTLSRPALVVDSDGTIDCPYVGRQKVNGMTTRQIEEMLRRLLGLRRDAQGNVVGGYLTNPNINMTVKDFRSQRVNIMGAVRTPGYVELKGDPTLTRALSQAGYPHPNPDHAEITHEAAAPGATVDPASPAQERIPRLEIENRPGEPDSAATRGSGVRAERRQVLHHRRGEDRRATGVEPATPPCSRRSSWPAG